MSPWDIRRSGGTNTAEGHAPPAVVRACATSVDAVHHTPAHQSTATRASTAPPGAEPGLRNALRHFATGTTVVTAPTNPPHGMTANAFTSVSLDPPLVLLCVRRASATHHAITDLGAFAVSVLAADQAALARSFADPLRTRDHTQFDGVAWRPGARTGAPLLTRALAWLECRVTEQLDGGDHSIFLASVLDSGSGSGQEPLVFHRGGYHRLAPLPSASDQEHA